MKSSFPCSLARYERDVRIDRLESWCYWRIAWIYGDTPPETLHLDSGKSPPPNRASLIADDLLHTEYVYDSGFIIDSFPNVRNSFELQPETGNSAELADITGIGAQETVLEYPIDDPMDTQASSTMKYPSAGTASRIFHATKNRCLYD